MKKIHNNLVNNILPYHKSLIDFRRLIHSNPEHAYKEYETSNSIIQKLKVIGVDEIHTCIAGTGIVAIIKGTKFSKNNRYIGLRCEMDALAISENTNLPWASKNEGYMHACGHDGHISILIGAVQYLTLNRDFSGTVCCIFQPAEEGGAGAKAMLNDKFLKRFPLSAIYAVHNAPWIPYGQICINHGAMMAAADRINITVIGKGGHGGLPQSGTDSILASANVITALQSIISRDIDPAELAVISIGAIQSGTMNQYSVLPEKVEMIGTVRSYSKSTQDIIIKKIHKIVEHTCAIYGATGFVQYTKCYPATINSYREAEISLEEGRKIYGSENVLSNLNPSTSGEDFAFFLENSWCLYLDWPGQI